MRYFAVLFLLVSCSCPPQEAPEPFPESLYDGASLGKWEPVSFGREGRVHVEGGELRFEAGDPLTGVSWKGAAPPRTNYELSLEARKIAGDDFFCGIIFPVKESHCSFVAGGWGGSVSGLSCVDYIFAVDNETSHYRKFETGRWYRFRLRVTSDQILVWLDDEEFVNLMLEGKTITPHPAVKDCVPLGITSYKTSSSFRNIRLKPVR